MVTPRFTFRTPNDIEADEQAGAEAATPPHGASLTQQQYTDEVNLNVMMARMGMKDGSIPPGAFDPRQFGTVQDFSDAPDLKEIFDRTFAARDMFMQLPATIRNRFSNNPAIMLDWVNNPANLEEARKLGFFEPAKTGAPAPVPPTTP